MLNKGLIKEKITEFFNKMTYDVEVEVREIEEEERGASVSVKIKTDSPQSLIGYKGEVLSSAQYILKSILAREIDSDKRLYLNLDINDYKEKKLNYLREIASSAADDVALIRVEKTLEPMNAEERRAVHMELAGRSDVTTESIGEGENRRIVVKPANQF